MLSFKAIIDQGCIEYIGTVKVIVFALLFVCLQKDMFDCSRTKRRFGQIIRKDKLFEKEMTYVWMNILYLLLLNDV